MKLPENNSIYPDNIVSQRALLDDFNNREKLAFGKVYSTFYDELYHFAYKLYHGTEVEPSDVIHDVFIAVWQSHRLKFDDFINIKAYIYICIKNKFRSYIAHQKHVEAYREKIVTDDRWFDVEVIESELSAIIDSLPIDYAQVLRLHIEGWDIKSIAEKLAISERTIFNRKNKAIQILKERSKEDKIYTLLICFLLN